MVTARSLVGGNVTTARGVTLENLGNDAEAKTVVDCGGLFLLITRKDGALKRISQVVSELGAGKELMFAQVRDGLDESGELSAPALSQLGTLKARQKEYVAELDTLNKQIEDLNRQISDMPAPVVRARALHPGVIIKYGTTEKAVKEPVVNATISFEGGLIHFVN